MNLNKIKIIIILGCFLLVACAPKARYNVLSFLFDGVPDLELEVYVAPGDSLLLTSLSADSMLAEISVKPSIFYHYPYQEKECMMCHNPESVGSLMSPEPDLCYLCHEDFSYSFANLHGPVEAGYCSICHEPHMSKYEKLLQLRGNGLCLKCHVEFKDKQPEFHHPVDDNNCVTCHNPHGEGEI